LRLPPEDGSELGCQRNLRLQEPQALPSFRIQRVEAAELSVALAPDDALDHILGGDPRDPRTFRGGHAASIRPAADTPSGATSGRSARSVVNGLRSLHEPRPRQGIAERPSS